MKILIVSTDICLVHTHVKISKKLLDKRIRFQYILNAEPNPSIVADVRAALTPSVKEGVFYFMGE